MSIPETNLKSISSYLSPTREPNWTLFDANLPEGYPKDRTIYTPLQIAIICQDIDQCRTLLEGGADPNEMGKIDAKPLFTALFNLKNEELGVLLVEKGAEMIEISINDRKLPLWFALLFLGKGEFFIKRCLEIGKIDSNTSIEGANILFWASVYPEVKNKKDILTAFIQKGASYFPCVTDFSLFKKYGNNDPEDELRSKDLLRFSLFDNEMFEFFYSQANETQKSHKTCDGSTIFHFVAQERNERFMQFCLSRDSSKPHLFRQITRSGLTPLNLAKHKNNLHYWSSETYKQLEMVDGGYTEWRNTYRKFANIVEYPLPFREMGEICTYYCDPDPNGKIKGLNNDYFEWVAQSFSAFTKDFSDKCEETKFILEALECVKERTPEMAFQRFKKEKKVVIIATAWLGDKNRPGHAISLIFWKSLCIKVCTMAPVLLSHSTEGATFIQTPENDSGVQFYRLGKDVSDSAIFESMTKLYDLFLEKTEEAQNYYFHTMNQELKLEFLITVNAFQTSANCPYLAAKYSLRALRYLFHMKDSPEINVRLITEAWRNVNFVPLEATNSTEAVKLLRTIVRSPYCTPELKEALYDHFLKKAIADKLLPPILELLDQDHSLVNWQEKETGRSLIRILYPGKGLPEDVFNFIISLSPDLQVADNNGKTFADDLLALPPPEWMAAALKDLDKYVQNLRPNINNS